MKKRVGIFGGSFDPVHQGHLAFALAAASEASLERVHFLPEARPPRKPDITDLAHRVAMLHLAIRPYPQLEVLEQPDNQFSVANTVPRLEQHFAGSQIFLLLACHVRRAATYSRNGLARQIMRGKSAARSGS